MVSYVLLLPNFTRYNIVYLLSYCFAGSWQEPHNRRVFFETYAKANEFDPLIAANWLAQTPEKIMSTRVRSNSSRLSLCLSNTSLQGASQVISYHNSSITKALGDLFPDVSFDSSKKFSGMFPSSNLLLYHEEETFLSLSFLFFVMIDG